MTEGSEAGTFSEYGDVSVCQNTDGVVVLLPMTMLWRMLAVWMVLLALPGCDREESQTEGMLRDKPAVADLSGTWRISSDSEKVKPGGASMLIELRPDGTFLWKNCLGFSGPGGDVAGTWAVSDEMLANGETLYGVCLQSDRGPMYVRVRGGNPRSLVVPFGDPDKMDVLLFDQAVAAEAVDNEAEEDYGSKCLSEIGQCFKSLGMAIYYGVLWLWRLIAS